MESEEYLLARVMAAPNVELPGIGDRVYHNIARRYHVCVEAAGRYIEYMFLVGPDTASFIEGRRTECGNVSITSCWGPIHFC